MHSCEFSYSVSPFNHACTIPLCLLVSSRIIHLKIYDRKVSYNKEKCQKIVIDMNHNNIWVINEKSGGAVVLWLARRTFDRTVGGSESRWFKARLVSSLLCCFLRQETLLHIVSLHPGI